MADFNTLEPKKTVTDPAHAVTPASQEYPRHLHKWAGEGVLNAYVVVTNDDEKADAIAKGYALDPVMEAPAEKTADAKKADAKK